MPEEDKKPTDQALSVLMKSLWADIDELIGARIMQYDQDRRWPQFAPNPIYRKRVENANDELRKTLLALGKEIEDARNH